MTYKFRNPPHKFDVTAHFFSPKIDRDNVLEYKSQIAPSVPLASQAHPSTALPLKLGRGRPSKLVVEARARAVASAINE